MELIDSRLPDAALFAHDGNVYIEGDLSSTGRQGKRYVSVPSRAVLLAPIDLSPSQIASNLDRGWRECTAPFAIESAYVEFFVGSTGTDFSLAYVICGRTVYSSSSGKELVHADDR